MWKKILVLIATFMGVLLICLFETIDGQLNAATALNNSSSTPISGALTSKFQSRTGSDIYISKTKIYYGLNDKKTGSPVEPYEIIKNVKNYGTLIMPVTALVKAPFYIGNNAGYISSKSDLVYNTTMVTFPEITGHFSALLTETERSIAYTNKSYTQKLEGIVGTSKDDVLFIPTVSEFQDGGTFGMNGKYRYADEIDEIYLTAFKSFQTIGDYPYITGKKVRRPRLEASDKKMKEYNGGDSASFGACYWLFGAGLTYAPDGSKGYGGMDSYNNYTTGGTGDIEIIGFPEEKDQLAGAGNSYGAVRPAALIDLDKIVFGLSPLTSTAKTMTTVDPKGDSTLQIRVLDDNITINVSEPGNYGDYTKGKKLEISYENATIDENQIISAIITDKDDNIIFYQRFVEANIQSKGSGTISIDTSKFEVADDYHVYLVNENVTDNTRAITSSDLTEKISFNIVPALHDLAYTSARGTTVNNAYQTIEPGHVKVGDIVGSVTSVDGADPITYDIVSADSTQAAPTMFSVINGKVKVNSNANVTVSPGVYQFRVRVYDKFEEPKSDAGSSPIDPSGNSVTGLTDQEGNEVTYGLVTDVITIVVYPHENQLTYTQQRFKGVFHTADQLNTTVTTEEVLGKIRISPSARLAQLKENGYELSSIEVVDASGKVIPELVVSEADSTYSGSYEIKKGTGTFISSIEFQLRLTFKNTDTNTTSAVLIFDDKGKDYVFRVPGIMGDLEVDKPIYYGDEDKLATLTTEYMNGVPAYFTSTDESIISINDTDLNDDNSSPLEIHKIGMVGIEVCQTAEPGYVAKDPCPTSAVYGYVEVTVLPREITLKLSDKTIYAGMKFPSYTFESEPVSGTFAYTDTITDFKVPENTSAKDNDAVLANTNKKGTYPITGSYSDTEKEEPFLSNYNVTISNGTLTIEEDTSNKSSYHLEDDEGNILAESTWYNHDVNVVIDVVNNDTGTYDQISASDGFDNEDLSRFKVTQEGDILQDIYYRINPESESERAGSIVIGNQASIYIDKKEPVIKGIETTQTNTNSLSRMLYSMTFGRISKPGVNVKIETEDPQAGGVNEVSGIREITYRLYTMDKETNEIDTSITPIEETVEPNDYDSYTFTVEDEGSYKVCAIANDNAGNPSSEKCEEFTVKLNQDDNTDDENNSGQTPDEGDDSGQTPDHGNNDKDNGGSDQDKPDDTNGGKDDINNGENPDTDKGDNDQNQGGNENNKPDDSNEGELPDDGKGDQNQDDDNSNNNDSSNDDFIDTDGDDCPDINIHYIDTNGKEVKLNWDINEDQVPDMNIDSNGDGKADLNIDTDEDGKPDLNLVILSKEQWLPKTCVTSIKDQEGNEVRYCTGTNAKAQINIDLDGDRVPDINIDHKGDFKPHINISKDGKIPSVNIAIIHTWIPEKDYTVNDFLYDTMTIDEKKDINTNIDTDGDGKPDINIDTDGDWIPDINIDGNEDGEADINIDTDKDGLPDQNIVDITEWKPNINGSKDGTEFGTMEISAPDQKNNSGNEKNTSNDDTTVKDSYNANGVYGSAIGGASTGDTSNLKWLCIITTISLFVIIKVTKKAKS